MRTKREVALTPAEFRAIWDAKPVLRGVYQDYYNRIRAQICSGPTVEIGAGGGQLKDSLPMVIATDVTVSRWLDMTLDAHALPFADGSLSNIVGVDVLHHIEYPRHFLAEAQRVLKPGGRVVLIEPAITPVSWLTFKIAHPEPVKLRVDPLMTGPREVARDPMDSNQALPTLLAGRHRARLHQQYPNLRIVHRQHFSLLAYPLSGGFRPWCLLPSRLLEPVLRAERWTAPALGSIAGFRLLLVVQRS